MIVLFLFIGFIIGFYQIFPQKFYQVTGFITNSGLVILLLAMGAKIGMDDRILSRMDQIGFQAIMLALAAILGSIICVKIFILQQGMELSPLDEKTSPVAGSSSDSEENGHLMTFMITGSVVAGILLGFFVLPEQVFAALDKITTYALAVLLFGVGVDMGSNRSIFEQLKDLGWQIIVLPFLVATGSILGAVVMGLLLGLGSSEAAAVGAGFGWYSLSGVILGEIYSVELGSLAFLTNVFREILTIISLPFAVKYIGRLTSIAPGGATTMDVTLPVIKETAGEEVVIPAFISGVVLSMLVPILVPFLIGI